MSNISPTSFLVEFYVAAAVADAFIHIVTQLCERKKKLD
jgi:hypothetical protein